MIYDRSYAKNNLKSLMQSLFSEKKYYISIESEEDKDVKERFEDGYRQSFDPDGNFRDLSTDVEINRVLDENPDVFNYILKKENAKIDEKRILDVGCGCGPFLYHISNSWKKFGIEISSQASKIAKKIVPNAEIANLDFEKNSYKSNFFDVILCHQVLEHVRRPEVFLDQFSRILKPGGSLILCIPNFDSGCARLFGKNYRFFHDGTHVTLFSPDSISRMVRDYGFVIENIEFPYFESEKYFNIENLKRLKDTGSVSPPFYGNLMTIYSIKK